MERAQTTCAATEYYLHTVTGCYIRVWYLYFLFSARYTTDNYREEGQPEVELDLPPPYRQSDHTTSIYIISGGDINVNIMPPGSVMSPPDYEDVGLAPPPEYTTEEPGTRSPESADVVSATVHVRGEPVTTISSEDLPSDPPTYEQSVAAAIVVEHDERPSSVDASYM